jgi:hypothetical protein
VAELKHLYSKEFKEGLAEALGNLVVAIAQPAPALSCHWLAMLFCSSLAFLLEGLASLVSLEVTPAERQAILERRPATQVVSRVAFLVVSLGLSLALERRLEGSLTLALLHCSTVQEWLETLEVVGRWAISTKCS